VWNFRIGSYQVCEKWLKDRKGRVLSTEDIRHYQRIVVALSETIRLMDKIDEAIALAGGWPGAFQGTATGVVDHDQTPRELMVAEPPPPNYRVDSSSQEAGLATESDRPTAVSWGNIMCLIRQIFSDGSERTRDAAIVEIGGHLGFQQLGKRSFEDVDNYLRAAVRRGVLDNKNGSLKLSAQSIEGHERSHLKEQFLASLEGTQWIDRHEAILGFGRWLGFRRIGKTIEEVTRSVINGLLREKRLESNGTSIRSAPAGN
jgi:hypothetical protein